MLWLWARPCDEGISLADWRTGSSCRWWEAGEENGVKDIVGKFVNGCDEDRVLFDESNVRRPLSEKPLDCLGQAVRDHLCGRDVDRLDISMFNEVSDSVISYTDVLAA